MSYSFEISTYWLWWLIYLNWDFRCHDFSCFTDIFVCYIDIVDLYRLILLLCLAYLLWFFPWLIWSLHMHRLATIYHSTRHTDPLVCILFWSSLSMMFVSPFVLIIIFSLILCVYMMIYLIFVWLHVAWLSSSVWLHVVYLCGMRIYPLISHPLVSVTSFITVLTFASVRPCVCLYSDRDRGKE